MCSLRVIPAPALQRCAKEIDCCELNFQATEMWHKFLERKFSALFKTVSIIPAASKLTRWQLIFRGVFWRPSFHLRRQQCALENRLPWAQFLRYGDVTHILRTGIQCRFQNCKYHPCNFKIDQMATDFARHILVAVIPSSGARNGPHGIGCRELNF